MKKLVNTIKDTFSSIFSSSKGFTLLELLVVVLIIGILASIALPQYKKAVLKAQLYKGIPLVESLYQAQQSYFLNHGVFATDLDDLDISVPVNPSCTKQQNSNYCRYICDFGKIGILDSFSNVQFQSPTSNIGYLHYLTDFTSGGLERKAGEVWCFAKTGDNTAQEVCKGMGGQFGNSSSTWTRYKIN